MKVKKWEMHMNNCKSKSVRMDNISAYKNPNDLMLVANYLNIYG